MYGGMDRGFLAGLINERLGGSAFQSDRLVQQ
jgi:hypothetical protein